MWYDCIHIVHRAATSLGTLVQANVIRCNNTAISLYFLQNEDLITPAHACTHTPELNTYVFHVFLCYSDSGGLSKRRHISSVSATNNFYGQSVYIFFSE